MGAEAGGEGADGGGVEVAPVHAGLLAASGDISPAGGLDGAGADVEALLLYSPVFFEIARRPEVRYYQVRFRFPAWGGSSVGRALRSQRRGPGFESPSLHHA